MENSPIPLVCEKHTSWLGRGMRKKDNRVLHPCVQSHVCAVTHASWREESPGSLPQPPMTPSLFVQPDPQQYQPALVTHILFPLLLLQSHSFAALLLCYQVLVLCQEGVLLVVMVCLQPVLLLRPGAGCQGPVRRWWHTCTWSKSEGR
jgi:hypothetical protein